MPACCYYNGACITPDARRHKANLGVHTTQWRGCTPNYIWNLPPYVWDYNGDIWIRSHLLSGMHIQEGTCLYIFCINRAVLPSSQGFSFQWGTRAPGPLRNFMSGIESTNFWLKPVEKKHPTCTPNPWRFIEITKDMTKLCKFTIKLPKIAHDCGKHITPHHSVPTKSFEHPGHVANTVWTIWAMLGIILQFLSYKDI